MKNKLFNFLNLKKTLFKSDSIYFNIIFYLIITIFIVSSIIAGLHLHILSSRLDNDYRKKASEYTNFLQKSLETPLREVDGESIEQVCDAFFSNEIISQLIIKDSNGEILYQNKREKDKNFIVKEKLVSYHTKKIGNIFLGLSSRYYKEASYQLILFSSISLLTLMFMLTIITTILLRKFLIKPLNILGCQIDKIANGNYNVLLLSCKQKEIKEVIKKINMMSLKIYDRENSLTRINKKLKDEIIKRHKIEKALKDNEEKFRRIINNLRGSFLYQYNLEKKFTYISPSVFDILGYTDEEFFKNSNIFFSTNSLHENDKKYFNSIFAEIRKPFYDIEFRHKDGSFRYLDILEVNVKDENGDIVAVEGIAHDITERKKIEVALKEKTLALEQAQKLLYTAFENSPAGIIITNVSDGSIKFVNSAFLSIIKQNRESLMNMSYQDYSKKYQFYSLEEKEIPFNDLPITKAMFKGEIARNLEMMIKKENGEKKFVLVNAAPINDVDDNIIAAVMIFFDITEKRKMQNYLNNKQKIESLGILAGGIAHDFNNVLASIIGPLSLLRIFLENEVFNNTEALKYLDWADSSAQRASEVVKRLLIMSRHESNNKKITDLSNVIEDVLTICKNTFNKNIEIKSHFDSDGDSYVLADERQLEQIILNICINAMHAMTTMRPLNSKQGGILSIFVKKSFLNDYLLINRDDLKNKKFWKITISDDGVGIDEQNLGRIFEPFFTTKEKENGTGLGLSIVYNSIKNHNGFIDVFSNKELGTTFYIYLPIYDFKEVNENKVESIENYAISCDKGKSLLILVIDDEKVIRDTIKKYLVSKGFSVLLASNGEEGLKIFRKNYEKIDLVILDMILSHISGDEVYTKMKNIYSNVKVLLISGFHGDQRVKKTIAQGANSFLRKPFTIQDFFLELSKILNNNINNNVNDNDIKNQKGNYNAPFLG